MPRECRDGRAWTCCRGSFGLRSHRERATTWPPPDGRHHMAASVWHRERSAEALTQTLLDQGRSICERWSDHLRFHFPLLVKSRTAPPSARRGGLEQRKPTDRRRGRRSRGGISDPLSPAPDCTLKHGWNLSIKWSNLDHKYPRRPTPGFHGPGNSPGEQTRIVLPMGYGCISIACLTICNHASGFLGAWRTPGKRWRFRWRGPAWAAMGSDCLG